MRRILADKRGSVGKDDSISHANVSDSSEQEDLFEMM